MPDVMHEMPRCPHCKVTLIDVRPPRSPPVAETTLQHLTPRERRVALLVAEGLSNAEVAKFLHRSRRTVESQITSIYRRLGINRRSQLVRRLMAAQELRFP